MSTKRAPRTEPACPGNLVLGPHLSIAIVGEEASEVMARAITPWNSPTQYLRSPFPRQHIVEFRVEDAEPGPGCYETDFDKPAIALFQALFTVQFPVAVQSKPQSTWMGSKPRFTMVVLDCDLLKYGDESLFRLNGYHLYGDGRIQHRSSYTPLLDRNSDPLYFRDLNGNWIADPITHGDPDHPYRNRSLHWDGRRLTTQDGQLVKEAKL